MGRPKKIKRRLTAKGRAALAKSGSENLRRYHEGLRSPATQLVHDRVAAFTSSVRAEFPNPNAIVQALIESAIASYSELCQVTSLQSLSCGRIDRVERLHGLLVQVQRVLFRVVNALSQYSDAPTASASALNAIVASISPIPDEEIAASQRKQVDADKARFACLEAEGEHSGSSNPDSN